METCRLPYLFFSELVVVVGDMTVSPPSPRRRPLPPDMAVPLPNSENISRSMIQSTENDTKPRTLSSSGTFRKSASVGDNVVRFRFIWEENTPSTSPIKFSRRGSMMRRQRKVNSLTRAESMKLSDFPCRVLKIFNSVSGQCLYESKPRHVGIESCTFDGSFHYPSSGRSKLHLRLDIWAESLSFVKNKGNGDSKSRKQRKIRLVGSLTTSAEKLAAFEKGESISVIDAHVEHARLASQETNPKSVSADSMRRASSKSIGRLVFESWTLASVVGKSTTPTERRSLQQRRSSDSPRASSRSGLRRIFGSPDRKKGVRRGSSHIKFDKSPRECMIGMEHFYTLEELQNKLRTSTSRAAFCNHLANAQKLITKSIPLHITHLSSAGECLGDLKRFAVNINGVVCRDHVKSATRGAAFRTFCSVLEDTFDKCCRSTIRSGAFFVDGEDAESSKPSSLFLGHHDSAPGQMKRNPHRRLSLRSITLPRRVSKSMPPEAPMVAWVCQNINENRIGHCVQKAILEVLGIDYDVNTDFILYDLSNQKGIKKEISKLIVTESFLTVEKIIHYELNNHSSDYSLMIHVKTIARLSIERAEEDVRFEMGFNEDKDHPVFDRDSHDVVLSLHSKFQPVPREELAHIYSECLGEPSIRSSPRAKRWRKRRVESVDGRLSNISETPPS